MIKFHGIIGYNCGVTSDINSVDKRTKEYERFKNKGYIISGGIETLRGFAKISDLANASTIDKGYQRSKDQEHVKDISIFLDEGRVLSKFLPEVILVGNKDNVNLNPFVPSGRVSQTVLGEISNLEYFTIEVAEKSLKRIDGNHRLEAGAAKDLVISFAIILWAESEELFQENRDNEAFLFHFLNGKAKKLTPEENYKGLATSTTWSLDELKQVNPVIPYLQQCLDIIRHNSVYNKDYFSEGPLSQFADVLEEIQDYSISPVRFKKIIEATFLALQDFQKFPYLKSEFNHLLPQLSFINFYYDKPVQYLITLSNWLKKYRYEKGSFENARNLYEIADKQLRVVHLKIFVAMPFWRQQDGTADIQEVIRYNKTYEKALKEVVGTDNPHIKLELIPIMLRKGKAVRIDSQILKEIEECDIFIGDTTENNHNVIFEIGYASALSKPAIIVRKKSFTEAPPFDIDKILYKQYEYDDDNFEKSLISLIKVNLPVILRDDFDLIINKGVPNEVIKNLAPQPKPIDNVQEQVQKLSETEGRNQDLESYEEMYIVEAKGAVSRFMDKAEWDFDQKEIEIAIAGKRIKVNSYNELEEKLEDVAREAGYPLIPDEGPDRESIFNNTDWNAIVQTVLANYLSQLNEMDWL